MKRLIVSISLGFALSLLSIQILTLYANQDIRFFRQALSVTKQWCKKLRTAEQSCLILAGGSEIRNGINPSQMHHDENMYAINAATGAGFGVMCNAQLALGFAKPGDTLLLSIHSGKNNLYKLTSAGCKLLIWEQGLKAFHTGVIRLNPAFVKLFFQSDAGAFLNTLARVFTGKILYRYHAQTSISPSGWMKIEYTDIQNRPPFHENKLDSIANWIPDSYAISQLQSIKNYCNQNKIKFILHLPVGYNTESVQPQRAILAYHLTIEGFDILKDERLGADPSTFCYADTYDHLSPAGVRKNTHIIAQLVKQHQYWNSNELEQFLQQRGWHTNGNRIEK